MNTKIEENGQPGLRSFGENKFSTDFHANQQFSEIDTFDTTKKKIQAQNGTILIKIIFES